MCKSVHFSAMTDAQPIRQRGFTLIELMVTVAVLAILSAIAIPNLTRFIDNARVASTINEYIAAVNLARAEAVRRGVRVTICAAASQGVCKNGGTNWTAGFIVFVDDGANPGKVDAGEEILKERNGWSGVGSVVGAASIRHVSYVANGQLENGLMVGRVSFTPNLSDLGSQRYVCIDRSGRPRMDELPC